MHSKKRKLIHTPPESSATSREPPPQLALYPARRRPCSSPLLVPHPPPRAPAPTSATRCRPYPPSRAAGPTLRRALPARNRPAPALRALPASETSSRRSCYLTARAPCYPGSSPATSLHSLLLRSVAVLWCRTPPRPNVLTPPRPHELLSSSPRELWPPRPRRALVVVPLEQPRDPAEVCCRR
jgi:hypothetical protein